MIRKSLKWLFLISFLVVFIVYSTLSLFLLWNAHVSESEKVLDEAIFASSTELHYLSVTDDGNYSLKERIKLIRSAKKSVDLEFFIFQIDSSAKIILNELIAKSEMGVKVRLMVDFALPVFKLKPKFARYLISKGIDVRYYNPTSSLMFVSSQHRSHRKLLIIDEQWAMTGGRNIGDEYFDLHKSYNFLDSDIIIQGPIVKEMKKSFNLYWNSVFSSHPDSNDEYINIDFVQLNDKDKDNLNNIEKIKQNKLIPFVCNDITFVTDFPGVSEKNRYVYSHLEKLLLNVKKEIWVESPYLVVRGEGMELLQKLGDKGIKTNILTNGLYSTDAYYTISALYPYLNQLAKANIELSAFSGILPGYKTRYGTHSKRAVFDNDTALIGTYNIDPRSANFNSEVLIVCKGNKKLVQYFKSSIKNRMSYSKKVIKDSKIESSHLFENSSKSQIAKFILALPLSNLFIFLL